MNKVKKNLLCTFVVLATSLSNVWPSNAGLFDCSCCDTDPPPEEIMRKVSQLDRHFGHLKMSIEDARKICPPAALQELDRRVMTLGDELQILFLRNASDLNILREHANLNLDYAYIYILNAPNGEIDLHGNIWIPPFGNFNPLKGFIINCNTIIRNMIKAGNLESGFYGAVGPAGAIYDATSNSWTSPGAAVITADQVFTTVKKVGKKMAPVTSLIKMAV
ncbi:MAG: hypothetical protein LBJ83_02190 [Oscillospiraceae bacterium]|jgi:hypothetical protein|nr:hypothetical protein [Oscillospiraceae bacterium]